MNSDLNLTTTNLTNYYYWMMINSKKMSYWSLNWNCYLTKNSVSYLRNLSLNWTNLSYLYLSYWMSWMKNCYWTKIANYSNSNSNLNLRNCWMSLSC